MTTFTPPPESGTTEPAGIPNMDGPFDANAATAADRAYDSLTDAEIIGDDAAFTKSYTFAAHRSARHLHAALAHAANLAAVNAGLRERAADLTKRLNKLSGVVASLGAVVVLADDTDEEIADEIRRAAAAAATQERDEARSWARHGYEIGQRSCTWADHGVAPKWLTEGHDPEALRGKMPLVDEIVAERDEYRRMWIGESSRADKAEERYRQLVGEVERAYEIAKDHYPWPLAGRIGSALRAALAGTAPQTAPAATPWTGAAAVAKDALLAQEARRDALAEREAAVPAPEGVQATPEPWKFLERFVDREKVEAEWKRISEEGADEEARAAAWASRQIGELIWGLARRGVDTEGYFARPAALALDEIDRLRSARAADDEHNDDCGSCCCCSVDTDRLRSDLAEARREAERLRGGVAKIVEWNERQHKVMLDPAIGAMNNANAIRLRALLSPTPTTPEAKK